MLVLSACGAKPDVDTKATTPQALDLLLVDPDPPIQLSSPVRPLGRTLRICGAPSGEYFLLDTDNHRVLHYGADGSLLGEAGGSGSGKGQFNGPVDIDADGQMIWILDRQNRRLVRMDQGLHYVEEISLSGSTEDISAPLWYDAVGASSNGDVFLLDCREPGAVRISSAGEVLANYGGFGTGNGRLEAPTDLDAGQDGTLFVTDGKRLLVFDRSGNLQREVSHAEPLARVEATGSAAWITTVSGQLLYYTKGKLVRVATSSGSIPHSVDLTLGRGQAPVLLDSEWSVWLLKSPPG
jgi:outer membrane protein assembly factor BamB